jgi:hypothetical protein
MIMVITRIITVVIMVTTMTVIVIRDKTEMRFTHCRLAVPAEQSGDLTPNPCHEPSLPLNYCRCLQRRELVNESGVIACGHISGSCRHDGDQKTSKLFPVEAIRRERREALAQGGGCYNTDNQGWRDR